MGKWILDVINTYNAFWLTLADKVIVITNIIATSGRKMIVTIFTVLCLTLIGMQSLYMTKEVSDLVILCIAGVAGFFFGFNIWEHFTGKSSRKDNKDVNN